MPFLKFLYFTRREKVAISILLSLIVISGVVYVASCSHGANSNIDDYVDDSNFIAFEASLKDIKADTTYRQRKQPKSNYSLYSYTKQTKLKEGEMLELNDADTTQLKMIPGIGSGFANRIVKYRVVLGGYNNVNQLKEVWGMDDYLFAKIVPYINLQGVHRRIDVNRSSLEELNKHPYINYKQASAMVDIRDRKGQIESIERLALLEEFTQKDISRLRPYLSFQ